MDLPPQVEKITRYKPIKTALRKIICLFPLSEDSSEEFHRKSILFRNKSKHDSWPTFYLKDSMSPKTLITTFSLWLFDLWVFGIGLVFHSDLYLHVPTLLGICESLVYHQLSPGGPHFRSGAPSGQERCQPSGVVAVCAAMSLLTATGMPYHSF